jgi:hypothetical protein
LGWAPIFYLGFSFHLKPVTADQAQDVKIVECSNGSRFFVASNGLLVGREGDVVSSGTELIAQTSLHSDRTLKDLQDHHLIRHPTPLIPRPVSGVIASIAS